MPRSVDHYVYRCYDQSGVLLYIGCTSNVSRRVSEHRRGQQSASRWLRVFMTRHEVSGPYPNLASALQAESSAIAAEHPVFNIQSSGVPTWHWRAQVATYLVERGQVELARETSCACWRETRAAGCRDSWCPAHRDEDRPVFDLLELVTS